MVRIVAYLRPHRLEGVRSAVAALGVNGMTVSDCRGTGVSREQSAWLGGFEAVSALPIRTKIEVVVPNERKEEVVAAIIDNARTGEPDDGKIFIETVADALRIRTSERGEVAV
ncbi:P-II family nitrogen regulator [bacterium]|nr:MAG: P-II family nitrogen regulator [bacterium]